jgi:hypothetical protein
MDLGSIAQLHKDSLVCWSQSKEPDPLEGYLQLVGRQHRFNYLLWCLEDRARDPQASYQEIAMVKGSIDQANQKRNDAIELIDEWLAEELLRRQVVTQSETLANTETPGSAIDRLSILALRIYHLQLQLEREKVDETQYSEVKRRLSICHEQREDLYRSLSELLRKLNAGLLRHKLYRQLKMYNDPRFNTYLQHKNADKNLTD